MSHLASQATAFLAHYKQAMRTHLMAAIALGLTAGLLLIAQAWLLASLLTSVIFNQQTLSDVWLEMTSLLALILIRSALSWLAEQTAFKASAEVKRRIRLQLHQKLFQLGPSWLAGQQSGDIVTTAIDGVEALENYYARYLPAMSLVVLVPIAMLIAIFPFDWLSGVTLLVTAPLIPFFMIMVGKGTEKLNQKQWQKLSRMSGHFLDMIQGLTTLKLFNTSRHEAKVIARIADEYRRSTMSVLRVAFLSSLLLEFLSTISIALVAVFIGFRLYYGQMDFFNGFFILLLAPEFYLPLRNMGTHYHARLEAIGAAEKMIDILDAKPLLDIQPDSSLDNHDSSDTARTKQSRQHANQTLPSSIDIKQQLQQPITLDNISFSYDDDRAALDKLSLIIPPRKTLAITGESGAGKSTLVKLLLGFEPIQQGHIYIGDTDLADIPVTQWHEHIAWLAQKPHLFHGSIKDNISLGLKHADQTAIESAAKQAFAHDFIMQFPEQYDTLIGENGEGLSGGQRQRLALARVFLKQASLIILDEASSHLDKESEQLISQALATLAKQTTMIMITHKPDTLIYADSVVVMESGKIMPHNPV